MRTPVTSAGPTCVERMETAHHEAAHAVTARLLGFDVPWVDVTPDGARLGICYTRLESVFDVPGRFEELHKQVRKNCVSLFAGHHAEHQLNPHRKGTRTGEDASKAREILVGAGLDPLTEEHLLHECSRKLVRRAWPAVEEVARALLAVEIVDQSDIDPLILRTLGERALEEFWNWQWLWHGKRPCWSALVRLKES